jgi:putative DNA methylase
MSGRKKLIEVALPLEAINAASIREKSIKVGKPTSVHLWWARRPMSACRAVVLASLLDDPSSYISDEVEAQRERQRLFGIIEEVVRWESANDTATIERARREILRSTNGEMPPLLDPFCGGGSIPLEAQRLGLQVYAADLNPVAVLVTKALVEIPPRFSGRPPVNPIATRRLAAAEGWKGAGGLAADVLYYGDWIRAESDRRIGQLYPKVRGTEREGGIDATVVAWLWARTVRCPNPACGARMPLVRSFSLSAKEGKQVWIEPIVDQAAKITRFQVQRGSDSQTKGTVNRRGATCIFCGTPVPLEHIRAEGMAGRIGAQMMAIAAEGPHGRLYVSPSEEHELIASRAAPDIVLDTDLPKEALGFRVQRYGMSKHRDLFTARQLVALTTLSGLVTEAQRIVEKDSIEAGLIEDNVSINDGGSGARA